MYNDTMAYLVDWANDALAEKDVDDYADALRFIFTLQEIRSLDTVFMIER